MYIVKCVWCPIGSEWDQTEGDPIRAPREGYVAQSRALQARGKLLGSLRNATRVQWVTINARAANVKGTHAHASIRADKRIDP